MHQDPDRPLVARAAAGDRDAFTELVKRHQSRVYNLAMALGVPRADAEDVAQDVFIRVYRGLERFRGDALFRTWLYQVTVNAARSHLASAGARAVAARARDDEGAPPAEPAVDDPFARRLADRQVIDRALATLPAEWREAVTLRDVEGLSYREIADATGAPLGTVESRIFRARQQLRGTLAALLERQDGR
jgi:RNA polymerase sigma-70 factor (ECF subfamily)